MGWCRGSFEDSFGEWVSEDLGEDAESFWAPDVFAVLALAADEGAFGCGGDLEGWLADAFSGVVCAVDDLGFAGWAGCGEVFGVVFGEQGFDFLCGLGDLVGDGVDGFGVVCGPGAGLTSSVRSKLPCLKVA